MPDKQIAYFTLWPPFIKSITVNNCTREELFVTHTIKDGVLVIQIRSTPKTNEVF